VGVVRAKNGNEKGLRMQREQVRLFNHLQSSSQGFIVKRGHLMKGKDDGVYHEKGVDVKMAVDLLVGAYEDIYDVAILVSSDTDLIPAIQKVKHLGKDVEYIGFAHRPSFGLQKYASISRLLIKDEIENFVLKEIEK
jgi:uncharacterized LabA/DUF88 family protein